MAITWGGASGRHQVGIDITMSPSSVTSATTSVTLTIRWYVRTDLNSINDTQTLATSGPGVGSSSVTFDMTRPDNTAVQVRSATYTRSLSYDGTVTATYKGSLSGVFNGGTPSHSRSFTIPRRPAGVPAAPDTPTVSSLSSSSAVVTTAANATNGAAVTAYQFQWDTVSNFSSPASGSGTSRSRTLTGLTRATTYYVRARVQNSAGWSAWSGSRSFKTSATVPDTPAAPSVDTITATGARIVATAPNNGGAAITSYGFTIRNADIKFAASGTSTTNTRTFTGLTRATTYSVQVVAINAIGESSWSPVRTFTTAATAPDAPAAPTSPTQTAASITVGYTPPTNGGSAITSWQVQWATDAAFTTGVGTKTGLTGASAEVTGLVPGSQYWLRVRAVNAVGTGAWSPAVTVRTLSAIFTGNGNSWADALVYTGNGTSWVLCQVFTGNGTDWIT